MNRNQTNYSAGSSFACREKMRRRVERAGSATLSEIQFWLNVGTSIRASVLARWGLSARREVPWTELWPRIGLDAFQPIGVHAELRRQLWETAAVASFTGWGRTSVSKWVRQDRYPADFPKPVLIFGPRIKLWLPIEVEAYKYPSAFGALYGKVRIAAESEGRPNAD